MKHITAMIKFYGGCIEDVFLFADKEKLAAAFEEATGTSYEAYLNDAYEPDLEHEYVECHVASNELGHLNKEQVAAQLVSVARSNIMELEGHSDLESRNNDSDDFFTTSVWSLKAALIDAYNLGRDQALAQFTEKASLEDRIKSADIRVAGSKNALDISEKKTDIER